MVFQVTISLDDDAAASDASNTVAECLKSVALHVENGVKAGRIIDRNGNKIGSWSY